MEARMIQAIMPAALGLIYTLAQTSLVCGAGYRTANFTVDAPLLSLPKKLVKQPNAAEQSYLKSGLERRCRIGRSPALSKLGLRQILEQAGRQVLCSTKARCLVGE